MIAKNTPGFDQRLSSLLARRLKQLPFAVEPLTARIVMPLAGLFWHHFGLYDLPFNLLQHR